MSGKSYNAKYLLPLDNQADKKSLELLVQNLFKKPPGALTSSQKSSGNYEFSKYSRNKYKNPPKPYNSKGWIKKASFECETVNPSGEAKRKAECSRKYGIELPTLEKSLAINKKYDNDVQLVNNLLSNIEPISDRVRINVVESAKEEKSLDCKHLSEVELSNICKRNLCYISDIRNGIQYSRRHKMFGTNSLHNNFSYRDLRYNTSMITFAYKQKQQMLDFLTESFCEGIHNPKTDVYFFKVLLPELCLKIFMDVHNMNQEQATAYLDKQPIELD